MCSPQRYKFLLTGMHSMEMIATTYAKGIYPISVTNNGPAFNRSNSRIECASSCSTRDDCHFFSWIKNETQCDMDSVEKGWHFNYTETNQGYRSIYMDTGGYQIKRFDNSCKQFLIFCN